MSAVDTSIISPAILYWGTPVVIVSSENEDGTTNIAPMSSAWWLGRSCVLGFASMSKTPQNLLRTGQCVLNLADETMVAQVDKLACTTGSDPVPSWKQGRGYHYVKDKWTRAHLNPAPSKLVRPQRVAECQVQMECSVLQNINLRPDLPDLHGAILAFEVRVSRIYIADRLRMDGYANRVDPDKWRPLIMSFQEFYGLGGSKLSPSVLGEIPEEDYRGLTRSDVKKLPGDDDDVIVAGNGEVTIEGDSN